MKNIVLIPGSEEVWEDMKKEIVADMMEDEDVSIEETETEYRVTIHKLL